MSDLEDMIAKALLPDKLKVGWRNKETKMIVVVKTYWRRKTPTKKFSEFVVNNWYFNGLIHNDNVSFFDEGDMCGDETFAQVVFNNAVNSGAKTVVMFNTKKCFVRKIPRTETKSWLRSEFKNRR